MSDISLTSLIVTAIGSLLIGATIGILCRSYFRLVAFLSGSQIAFITYLEHLDIIEIQWNNIDHIAQNSVSLATTLRVPKEADTTQLYNSVAVIGGLSIGFIIGYKYG